MKKSIILVAGIALLATSYATAEDYSNALAFFKKRTKSRTIYVPNNQQPNRPISKSNMITSDLSEEELILQVEPASRQIYYMMNDEGKAIARELASNQYKNNKNLAVREARDHMLQKGTGGQLRRQFTTDGASIPSNHPRN